MKGLTKLPGYRSSPPGLEWSILKRLPLVTAAGTVIPALVAAGMHLMPPTGAAAAVQQQLTLVNIFAVATVITVWTAAFTVAIGCAIVWVMKGPAYVADPYPLHDSDRPER